LIRLGLANPLSRALVKGSGSAQSRLGLKPGLQGRSAILKGKRRREGRRREREAIFPKAKNM